MSANVPLSLEPPCPAPAPSAVVVLLAGLAMSAISPEFDAFAGTPGTGRGVATRSVVYGTHGMVACAQPLAAQAGLEVLKAGGSAVDAAIAINACLGLMEPTANGIGGDLFASCGIPRRRSCTGSTPVAARRWGYRLRRSSPSRTARSRSTRPTRGACPVVWTAGRNCTRSSASCRSRATSRPRSSSRTRASRFRRSSRATGRAR
jgi:hypothetical protein